MRPSKLFLLLLALPLGLAACGGGGSGGSDAPTEAGASPGSFGGTVDLVHEELASPTRSGTVALSSDGIRNFAPPTAIEPLLVGSFGVFNLPVPGAPPSFVVNYRTVLEFDLSAIPEGSEIVEAWIITSQTNIEGVPYDRLGGVVLVDHVDLGETVSGADYDSTPLRVGVGVISDGPTVGDRRVDVTEAVRDDWRDGRTRSAYRLRFPIEGASIVERDLAVFQDPLDARSLFMRQPLLGISYRPARGTPGLVPAR